MGKLIPRELKYFCPGLHIQAKWGQDSNQGLWLPLSRDMALLSLGYYIAQSSSLPACPYPSLPSLLTLPSSSLNVSSCETLARSTCLLDYVMVFIIKQS